jgi:hypothetical protein
VSDLLIIKHRCNDISQLINTDINYGIEIDLRNHGNSLVVVHDPFDTSGPLFSDWMQEFRHKFLIINVKEEGLESKILDVLKNTTVQNNYFILDESFPFIHKWAALGINNFAIRVSEFESSHTAINLQIWLNKINKRVDWIWADCFQLNPMPLSTFSTLKIHGFKICFVSPELHIVDQPESWNLVISHFVEYLKFNNIIPDAVCTKVPENWSKLY